jgi:hypothetical protein
VKYCHDSHRTWNKNNSADEGQKQLTIQAVMRQKNMVMSPAGLGTKNDYAGKSQQQFT